MVAHVQSKKSKVTDGVEDSQAMRTRPKVSKKKNKVTRATPKRVMKKESEKTTLIPRPTLIRLTHYLVLLEQYDANGKKTICSSDLAYMFSNTASQVRQDIYQLETPCRCGQGYSIAQLIAAIRQTLKLKHTTHVALVGCGRIGLGLAHNIDYTHYGMQLRALFDVKEELIGQKAVHNLIIEDEKKLQTRIAEEKITVAILTVPDTVAQLVTDKLVESGIRAILNYTHERLRVPDSVEVKDQQVVCALMQLAYYANTPPAG